MNTQLTNDQLRAELTTEPTGPRKLHQIARDIKRNWHPMYFGAVPYVDAMLSLETINDAYGCDSAKSIVLYFLANAQTWRGPLAKSTKLELKKIAGVK